jgi:hypothetical protein
MFHQFVHQKMFGLKEYSVELLVEMMVADNKERKIRFEFLF